MPTRIKNCGLKTPEALEQAIATGASFVGFVHHEKSPRHISIAAMAALMKHTASRIKTVAVLVNPDDALLHEVVAASPDYIQLHHVVIPARIQAIAALTGIPIISALSVRTTADLSDASALEDVSAHLLFDAPNAGSGHRFDWQLLRGLPLRKPWFLAGGLSVETVAEAIRVTGAPMVDVSSGIERAVGIKSEELIASFNKAVLANT